MSNYLTSKKALEFSNRSISTLKRWAKAGKVKTRKDRGQVQYLATDLAALVKGGLKAGRITMPKGEQAPGEGKTSAQYDPPSWLSDEAGTVFHEIMRDVESYAVVQPADIHGLAMCAKYLAEFRACEVKLREPGQELIVIDKNKSVRINPLTRHQRQCAEMFFQYSARYGLTPSDRESLKIVVKKADESEAEPVR